MFNSGPKLVVAPVRAATRSRAREAEEERLEALMGHQRTMRDLREAIQDRDEAPLRSPGQEAGGDASCARPEILGISGGQLSNLPMDHCRH